METAIKIGCVGSLVWLVHAAVGVARALRTRPGGRVNQMAHEVPVLRVVRPVLGLVVYAAMVDWLIPGWRWSWAVMRVPLPLRGLGVALCIASVALVRASFRTLGTSYRGGVGLWPDHALVTRGPYAFIRHPIYVGFSLLMAGLWAASGSWVLGLSGLALTASITGVRLPTEERELRQRFGLQYAAYEGGTPRFLPRLRRRRSSTPPTPPEATSPDPPRWPSGPVPNRPARPRTPAGPPPT